MEILFKTLREKQIFFVPFLCILFILTCLDLLTVHKGTYENSQKILGAKIASNPTPLKGCAFYFGDRSNGPALLSQLISSLPSSFLDANKQNIQIEIAKIGSPIPLPAEDAKHPFSSVKAKYPYVKDEDMKAIWYYDGNNSDSVFLDDLMNAVQQSGCKSAPGIQFILTLVQPSRDYLGATYSWKQIPSLDTPITIVRTPSYGGWAISPDYSREDKNSSLLVDVSIHEIGHGIGLAHACASCNSQTTQDLINACFDSCEWKNDVMSYGRKRPATAADPYNKFLACNLAYIEGASVPTLLAGVKIPPNPYQTEGACDLGSTAPPGSGSTPPPAGSTPAYTPTPAFTPTPGGSGGPLDLQFYILNTDKQLYTPGAAVQPAMYIKNTSGSAWSGSIEVNMWYNTAEGANIIEECLTTGKTTVPGKTCDTSNIKSFTSSVNIPAGTYGQLTGVPTFTAPSTPGAWEVYVYINYKHTLTETDYTNNFQNSSYGVN